MTAGVLFRKHEDFMGFSRDHRRRGGSKPKNLSTESILRNPHVARTTWIGEFSYEDVFMDLYLVEADLGHDKVPAGDFFGIAVDPRQSFAILFYDLAASADKRKVTRKLESLKDGDFVTIRELERQSSTSAEMVSRSQFDSAF